MQEYGEAMRCIDTTLAMEPSNSQAKEIKQLIKQKQDRGWDIVYELLVFKLSYR